MPGVQSTLAAFNRREREGGEEQEDNAGLRNDSEKEVQYPEEINNSFFFPLAELAIRFETTK